MPRCRVEVRSQARSPLAPLSQGQVEPLGITPFALPHAVRAAPSGFIVGNMGLLVLALSPTAGRMDDIGNAVEGKGEENSRAGRGDTCKGEPCGRYPGSRRNRSKLTQSHQSSAASISGG